MRTLSKVLPPLLFSFFLIPSVFAESPRMIAHQVQGNVKVEREGEMIPVHEDSRFLENDKIITDKDGYVDIVANEVWGVRLLPSSEILLTYVESQQTKLELVSGEFLFSIRPLSKEEKFEVETPTTALVVQGAEFLARITPKNVLSAGTFSVKKGIVEVTLKELKIPVTLTADQAVDLPVSYSFPEVRSANENEKTVMKKIDEIPLLLLKANIGEQLAFLKDLEKLKKSGLEKSSKN